MKMNEEEIKECLRNCSKLIKSAYDIELTWGETLALKNYILSFSNLAKRETIDETGIHGNATHLFMKDYFGIDIFELCSTVEELDRGGRMSIRKFGLGFVSKDYYISDERFKEYCRRRVGMWREEES